MFGRWILAIAAIAMVAPSAARASTMQFFAVSAGAGNTLEVPGPVVDLMLSIQYLPGTAEGGANFGLGLVTVSVTGDLMITGTTARAASAVEDLSQLPATWILASGGALAGEFGPDAFNLVDLTISGAQRKLRVDPGHDPAKRLGHVEWISGCSVPKRGLSPRKPLAADPSSQRGMP